MTMPPEFVYLPLNPWPPLRTGSAAGREPAKTTASATSRASRGRSTSAGRPPRTWLEWRSS
ncbi:hypothetical protein SCANM63S_06526 [Streptomyces canarius]